MKYFIQVLVLCALTVLVCLSSGPGPVVVVGHSFVAMAPWQDSGIQNLTVRGFNSEPCSYFQQLLPYLVPVGTQTVVLVEGTNDIEQGVTPQAFAACMLAQVQWIQ